MTSPSSDSFLNSLKGGLFWLVLVLSVIGYIQQTYRLWKTENEITSLHKEIGLKFESFDQKLGRSETVILDNQRSMNSLVKSIPADIKRDLKAFKADIKSFNKFLVEYNSSKRSGKVSPRPRKKSRKKNSLHKKTSNSKKNLKPEPKSSSKTCNWDYSDWRLTGEFSGSCGDGVFSYKLHQQFEGVLIEGEGNAGSSSYVRVWELDEDGERISPPLLVKAFRSVKKLSLSEDFQWLALHLDIGISLAVASEFEILPTVGLSFSGHGSTVNDLNWRLFRFGIEPSPEKVGVSFCPGLYNVGKPLPLFSNIWIGPCYGYDGSSKILLQLTGVL